jgi:hypothetical protein
VTRHSGPPTRSSTWSAPADPVRHHQHRGSGHHQGRGRLRPLGGRPARRAVGYQTESTSNPAPGRGNVFARLAGRRLRPRRPDDSRSPRRGARRGRGLERAPVLRRRHRRLRLGPRRRRHEGHGRDDDRRRPAAQTRGRRAAARPGVRLRRRRGGRRHFGCKWLVENRPDLFDRGHRGGRRGRRVLADRAAPTAGPSPVPGRDRREGHAVDAADRRSTGRARFVRARRQRRHRARRGGRVLGGTGSRWC